MAKYRTRRMLRTFISWFSTPPENGEEYCPRRRDWGLSNGRPIVSSIAAHSDKTEDHVIWLIAVSNNFLVARAAYDAAVKYNPRERWLLRDGIRVVERYEPQSASLPRP